MFFGFTDFNIELVIFSAILRGRSLVGRAPALHAGGRRFESDRLHHDFG